MKETNKIVIRIYTYKYRYIIYLLLFIIMAFVINKSKKYIFIPVDSTMMNIMGALLGAIVGGIFTLIGSMYVNNRQLTSNFEIKRKNTIYKPLYDELLEINKIITEENPYPSYIVFRKEKQTIKRHPQIDAWNRINSDSRILEIPKCLKEQYNRLIKSIKEYEKIRSSVNQPINNVLNEQLEKRFNINRLMGNMGDIISSQILQSRFNEDFLKSHINFLNCEKNLSDEQVLELERALLSKCNELDEVKNIRTAYNDWIEEQNKTMKLLENLIIEVAIKYEKQKK